MYRALYLANKLDLEAVGVVANDIPQKFIMLKNEIREIFARDKNYFKGFFHKLTASFIQIRYFCEGKKGSNHH